MIWRSETACRSCGGSDLRPILSFGETPLADHLVTAQQLDATDPTAPLDVACCHTCSLVQITTTVRPEILFGDAYVYYSSVSSTLLAHSRTHALELIERRRLGPDSLVLEIASNDGYLLRNFAEHEIPVLGVDPAPGPAAAAREAGVPTLNEFFGLALARRLAAEDRQADVVIANNVLAHVADLNGFVGGIATVLAPDGIAVFEVPYLADLIEVCAFDTIYHQHLCYFSVTSLDHLFRRHGLAIRDVRGLSIHGGSIRVEVARASDLDTSPAVRRYLQTEAQRGLASTEAFAGFARRVEEARKRLRAIIAKRKVRGERIAAYGAAAKATTLLAWCGLDQDSLEYVVDRNDHKHGRFMPGCRLPIVPVERLLEDQPDAVLLLTWNFADEIMAQQIEYMRRGGVFIVPIPEPREATQAIAHARATAI